MDEDAEEVSPSGASGKAASVSYSGEVAEVL